jgi:hypothetical protein
MSEKEFENYKSNPTSPYNDPKSPRYHSTLSWQDPIYPSWGMYYSNRQDLSKFDSNLSKKLIAFMDWSQQQNLKENNTIIMTHYIHVTKMIHI